MPDDNLTVEVRAFFEQYAKAFASSRGERIAELYYVPTVTMRGDGSVHCLQSRQELARFFQGVVDIYQRDGYVDSRFLDLGVTPIGGRSVLATMDWEMLRADGSLIRRWRQSYNLVRVEHGWQVLVSTFHLPLASAAGQSRPESRP